MDEYYQKNYSKITKKIDHELVIPARDRSECFHFAHQSPKSCYTFLHEIQLTIKKHRISFQREKLNPNKALLKTEGI